MGNGSESGTTLVEVLVADPGWRVVGLSRNPPKSENQRLSFLAADLTDLASTKAALARVPIERLTGTPVGPGSVWATLVVLGLLAGVAVIGVLWRSDWWTACAACFFLITIPLYLSLGTNLSGASGLFSIVLQPAAQKAVDALLDERMTALETAGMLVAQTMETTRERAMQEFETHVANLRENLHRTVEVVRP